jgi:peptidoglycan/LPS O-acetylase OafA/YrhL
MSLFAERYVADPLLLVLAFGVAIGEAAILSWCFSRSGGVFAKAVAPSNKVTSLEGLRGLLAFSVVAHHACAWYFFLQTGAWGTGNSIVFARLASFGVLQFFYLSGYLFWTRLMRRGRIPLGRFYLSRFIRIGPVYYVCTAAAILIGLAVTGPGLRVHPAVLARSLGSWLLFCMGGVASVNGADTSRIIAGVTWTLAMEWGFYLMLPFLGWFSRAARRLIPMALVFGGVWLVAKVLALSLAHFPHLLPGIFTIEEVAKFMLIGFGGGIAVATFQSKLKFVSRLSPARASSLLLVLYLAFLFVPVNKDYGEIFLLCGFAMVVQGTNLFGLITSRGVRLLGIVSYPIYVVHGMVYYLAARIRGGMHPVPLREYIPETLLCMAIVVLVATAVHFAVERPTMLISERIARGERPQAVPTAGVAV